MGELLEWWALSDLNGRPFGCKPNALTAELSAPSQFIVQEAPGGVNAPPQAPVRVRKALLQVRGVCRADAASQGSLRIKLRHDVQEFLRDFARFLALY